MLFVFVNKNPKKNLLKQGNTFSGKNILTMIRNRFKETQKYITQLNGGPLGIIGKPVKIRYGPAAVTPLFSFGRRTLLAYK